MNKIIKIAMITLMLLITASTASASKYTFDGENVTDGIFREMYKGFFYQETVTWNGEEITIDEAKALYYESHPDSVPKYNTVRHVGHSTVSYGSSSSNTANEPPRLDIVDNDCSITLGYQYTDGGVLISENDYAVILALNDGDGDVTIEDNSNSYIYVDNRGSGTVTQRNNHRCAVVIKNGNVYV
jgi:hypothetical protein